MEKSTLKKYVWHPFMFLQGLAKKENVLAAPPQKLKAVIRAYTSMGISLAVMLMVAFIAAWWYSILYPNNPSGITLVYTLGLGTGASVLANWMILVSFVEKYSRFAVTQDTPAADGKWIEQVQPAEKKRRKPVPKTTPEQPPFYERYKSELTMAAVLLTISVAIALLLQEFTWFIPLLIGGVAAYWAHYKFAGQPTKMYAAWGGIGILAVAGLIVVTGFTFNFGNWGENLTMSLNKRELTPEEMDAYLDKVVEPEAIVDFDPRIAAQGADELAEVVETHVLPAMQIAFDANEDRRDTDSSGIEFVYIVEGINGQTGAELACTTAETWFTTSHFDHNDNLVLGGFEERVNLMAYPEQGQPLVAPEDAEKLVETARLLTTGENSVCHNLIAMYKALYPTVPMVNEDGEPVIDPDTGEQRLTADWELAKSYQTALNAAVNGVNSGLKALGYSELPSFDGFVEELEEAGSPVYVDITPTPGPTNEFQPETALTPTAEATRVLPTARPTLLPAPEEPTALPTPMPTATPRPTGVPTPESQNLFPLNSDYSEETSETVSAPGCTVSGISPDQKIPSWLKSIGLIDPYWSKSGGWEIEPWEDLWVIPRDEEIQIEITYTSPICGEYWVKQVQKGTIWAVRVLPPNVGLGTYLLGPTHDGGMLVKTLDGTVVYELSYSDMD